MGFPLEGFKELWVYTFVSEANSKLLREQFTLSRPAREDANPWSTLFKARH